MYAIGLMSGTSADGIDGVVLNVLPQHYEICRTAHISYSNDIQHKIRQLSTTRITHASQSDGLDVELAHLYAKVVLKLVDGLDKTTITVIGSHGQTINHSPNTDPAFSLQVGDGQTLANLTGLPVVANFRAADIAAGGQGAPLTPAFHQAAFASSETTRAIINIGGIANATILSPDKNIIGFDTGPGNALIDLFCRQHYNRPYDDAGKLAEQGKVIPTLLDAFLSDDYFHLTFPKSTGLEYFNRHWVDHHLQKCIQHRPFKNEDVLATLTTLTAQSIVNAITEFNVSQIYVCGGGTKNHHIMSLIKKLSDIDTCTTDKLGIDPQWIEAAAFAWMAQRTQQGLTSVSPSVTGARKATIAGEIFLPSATSNH